MRGNNCISFSKESLNENSKKKYAFSQRSARKIPSIIIIDGNHMKLKTSSQISKLRSFYEINIPEYLKLWFIGSEWQFVVLNTSCWCEFNPFELVSKLMSLLARKKSRYPHFCFCSTLQTSHFRMTKVLAIRKQIDDKMNHLEKCRMCNHQMMTFISFYQMEKLLQNTQPLGTLLL